MAEAPLPRRTLSRPRKILFGSVTVLGLLAAVEACCRITEPDPKYRYAELTGFEPLPGAHTRGGRHEDVNSLGLRGREATERKAAGTFRILAMGGSTTWGHRVDQDETWPVQLETRLGGTGHRAVEVLNGGVPGWGLEQILLSLEHDRLARLEPDLVLVYEGWNHPLRNNPLAERYAALAESSPEKGFLGHFAIARWIERRMEESAEARRDGGARAPSMSALAALRRRELPPLVDRLAALSRDRHVRVAVIAFPSLVQCPLPDTSRADERRQYAQTLDDIEDVGRKLDAIVARDLEDYRSAVEPMREGAQRNGLLLLDVAERMRAAAADGPGPPRADRWMPLFKDRMHLSAEGNRAFAAALANLLDSAKLVP